METQSPVSSTSGFSLIELLVVLAVLGVCLALGTVSIAHTVRTGQARGAAQSWQAAAGWAQIGALWQGGIVKLSYAEGSLALTHNYALCGGVLSSLVPPAPVSTNLARWREAEATAVTFSGAFASPDGGGSLYFNAIGGAYRVAVRPESGLTARSWVEVDQ